MPPLRERTPKHLQQSTDSPDNAVVVTPNDNTDLAVVTRAIYVGTTGDVTVDMFGTGSNLTFKNVPAGTWFAIQVTRIYATDTTATDIVAGW